MAEQTELDLPSPAPQPAAAAKRAIFAGFSSVQIVAGLLVIGVLIWGMWVTKALITPTQQRIVSARLSSIVGESVPPHARSTSPPTLVEAELRWDGHRVG